MRDDQRNYFNGANNSPYYSLFNQPNIVIPRNMDTNQEPPNNRSFATFHQQVQSLINYKYSVFQYIVSVLNAIVCFFIVTMVRSRTITTWTTIRTTTWPWHLGRRNIKQLLRLHSFGYVDINYKPYILAVTLTFGELHK